MWHSKSDIEPDRTRHVAPRQIDEDGNEFLNPHGRTGDVRLVASAPTLPDVPDVVVRGSLPSGMPPPPSAESSDNKVDYEADDEVDYDGDA